MTVLNDIFGYCTIPKGTFLYRGHKDTSLKDCMFFATMHNEAGVWDDKIQIWKTKIEIRVLFAVDYLTSEGKGISALPGLFNRIFPSERDPSFTDLDIKHWDLVRRDKLVRKLFDDYEVSGWLSSVENKTPNEVCLFDKGANSNQIKLVEISDRSDRKYFKDSLMKIKIFPSQGFYDLTRDELEKRSSPTLGNFDSYKMHKQYISASIKYYVERGMERRQARHLMYNLRLNLEI